MRSKNLSFYLSPVTSIVLATAFLISLSLVTHAEAPPTTLTLVKQVIGDASPSDWALFAVSTGGDVVVIPTGETQPITAGSYSLGEDTSSAPAGFTQEGWKCSGFSNGGHFTAPDQLTINEGENVTCTVTNFDNASPSLKLVKVISDGSANPGDWQLSATTQSGAGNFTDAGNSTEFHRVRLFSTYTISESGPADFDQTGFSCDGDDSIRTVGTSAEGPTVQINQKNTPEQSIQITCTVTNTPHPSGGGDEKQTPTLSISNSPQTYSGSAQTATVAGSVNGVVSDIKYNGSSAAPSDVATYAVTADFTPTDTQAYNTLDDAAAGDFTITKADSTTSVDCPSSVVYSGSGQEPCTALATGPGLSQSLDVSYSGNLQVGTAHASSAFEGDSNHNGSSAVMTFEIAKADPTITVTPYSVVFDGAAHTAVGIAKGVLNEVLSGLSLSGTTHTAIGIYNDIWNFIDQSGNYNNKSGNVTDKISFSFGGFLPPITSNGHMDSSNTSIFKAGSTVPVKFQLKNAAGAVMPASSNPPWIIPIQGPVMTTSVTTAADYTDAPSSGAFYSWDSDHYQYNWKTKGFAPGYWYYLYVLPGDGNIYSTIIGLR